MAGPQLLVPPKDVQIAPIARWRLAKLPDIMAVAVALGGSIALFSWWSDRPNARSFLALKGDVALTFILSGLSLRWMCRKGLNHTLGWICAFLITIIGFLALLSRITRWKIALNELFSFLPAGREIVPDCMPFLTGTGFFLTGSALLLLDRKTRGGQRPAHMIVLLIFSLSALALIGHLYRVSQLYQLGDYQFLTLYTPLLFLLLAAGILAATPDGSFMETLLGDGVGSVMLRRLLPSVIALLVLLSWLRLTGQRANLFGNDVGTALMVVAHILIFATLVFGIAFSLNRSDLQRQMLERRIHERTLSLEAANRELEAFAYSVAHDLRAPLRAIDGLSLATLQDYGDQLGSDAKASLERIRHSAHRMSQLINGLLELSHMSRAQIRPEPIDLTEMARQIMADLQQREPHREAQIVIAEGLSAHGDASLLGAAIENLLSNAWKFSSRKPQTRIEFGRKLDQREPTFFVRDNGIGFDMSYASKLFGPFQRLHSQEFAGHGIGLASAQRIIQRHGGRIWAESKLEDGATFYFTLKS